MSPQVEATKIPHGYSLAARPTCQPQTDERPMLRDKDGRVLATVETWCPDVAVN